MAKTTTTSKSTTKLTPSETVKPAVKRKASNPSISTPKEDKSQTPRLAAMPADREHMIQTAAYHLAEKDGFQSGREEQYWLQAEAQIDQLLRSRHSTEQH